MKNRVVLDLVSQEIRIRTLNQANTVSAEQQLDSSYKVLKLADMSEDIAGDNHVRVTMLPENALSYGLAEEITNRWDAALVCLFG